MRPTGQGDRPDRLAQRREQPNEPLSLQPRPSHQFVLTPQVEEIVQRALAYLGAGYPVNLAGPTGTGKTTLALHLAARLGQPVVVVHGDDQCNSSDLVGSNHGHCRSRLIDNYLTSACRCGHTLVYDDFTLSRPEAYNALLSVLDQNYVEVHPNFRAILTSNPQECTSMHAGRDSLLERLITIHIDHYDRETEIAITASKSGISQEDAARIVDVVRSVRRRKTTGYRPTIRAAIVIAWTVTDCGSGCDLADPLFRALCYDALSVGTGGDKALASEEIHAAIDEVARRAEAQRVEAR